MPIDYKEYPKNWKTEIRPAILKRAKNCCEYCGVQNHRLIHRYGKGVDDWEYYGEGIETASCSIGDKKSTKVILTIAHLDHDKLNHNVSFERLKALCQKCHLRLDMDYHVSNRRKNKYKNNHKLDL